MTFVEYIQQGTVLDGGFPMRKALKEEAASRIFLWATGVEPRIPWKLEKSYNGLFETEATFLVPTFVLFLALPFPPPHPRTPSHGIWIRWHYFYY